MPVLVRPAAFDDIPAMFAIERQTPSAAHWTFREYMKLVDYGVSLVAEEAGQLCGFVCAKPVAGEWEIENVVVSAVFLHRGIANQLLGALIQRAKREAASAILLEVRESNLPARGLYGKHAFRQVGRRRGYYQDPVEDAVMYKLSF